MLHRIINNQNLLQPLPGDSSHWRLAEGHVSSAVNTFFGMNVAHTSSTHAAYWNGFYYGEFAEGETFDFSRVIRLKRLPSGLYQAEVNVYTTEDPSDTRGKMNQKFLATIERQGSATHPRFILLDYLRWPTGR